MVLLGAGITTERTLANLSPEPTVYIYPSIETVTSTTYSIILTQNSAPLNVFEFTLEFDSSKVAIVERTYESELCRPELTVANEYDQVAGTWYVACGNFVPFAGTDLILATFTITHPATEYSWLRLSDTTSLFLHDGLGTQLTPRTLPWLHNHQLLSS